MSLNNFFIEPFERELWYSILTRNFEYSTFDEPNDFIREAYNITGQLKHILCLPARINRFVSVNSFISKDEIIYNYTPYPYFAPFLAKTNQKALWKKEGEIDGKKVIPSTQLRIKYQSPLYCPECMKEALEKCNCAYLRVEHHLPGINFCPIHHCSLRPLPTKVDKHYSKNLLPINPDNLDLSPTELLKNPNIIKVGNMALELLDNRLDCFNSGDVNTRILTGLSGLGIDKRSDEEKLKSLLFKTYGDDFILNAELNKNILREMEFDREKAIDPIECLLLIGLFCSDLNSFFKIDPVERRHRYRRNLKFEGKFSCLNPFCKNSKTKSLPSLGIHWRNGYPVVRCPECGFTYQIINGDPDVLQYGSLWQNTLEKLVMQGKTTDEISEIFGISRHIIASQRRRINKGGNLIRLDKNIERYKTNLNQMAEQKENRSELLRDNKSKHPLKVLRFYEPDWVHSFLDSLPEKVKQQNENDLDDKVLVKLKKATKKIKDTFPPVRVTHGNLVRNIKELGNVTKLYRLPKSLKYIQTNKETTVQWHVRKVTMLVEHFVHEGKFEYFRSRYALGQVIGAYILKDEEVQKTVNNILCQHGMKELF